MVLFVDLSLFVVLFCVMYFSSFCISIRCFVSLRCFVFPFCFVFLVFVLYISSLFCVFFVWYFSLSCISLLCLAFLFFVLYFSFLYFHYFWRNNLIGYFHRLFSCLISIDLVRGFSFISIQFIRCCGKSGMVIILAFCFSSNICRDVFVINPVFIDFIVTGRHVRDR